MPHTHVIQGHTDTKAEGQTYRKTDGQTKKQRQTRQTQTWFCKVTCTRTQVDRQKHAHIMRVALTPIAFRVPVCVFGVCVCVCVCARVCVCVCKRVEDPEVYYRYVE